MEDFSKRVVVFAAFVLLGTLIKLAQHNTKDLHYNFLCPIIVISEFKLACSLLLYSAYDGALAQIPQRLQKSHTVVLRYSVVAGLFCAYDVLSFVNLSRLDPQTYLVFLQLRTVITGVVWEVAFKKRLSWMQRGGLALICVGCILKQAGAGFSLAVASKVSSFDYLLLIVQVGTNCLAGVANELLLKQKGGVPLNLQNAVQYGWTIIWCLGVGIFCPIAGVHLNPFDVSAWTPMFDMRMIPAIVILVVLGLITSVVLKLLDSVWKAVATSIELFLTSFASAWIFGYPVQFIDLVALGVVVSGVGLYANVGNSKPMARVQVVATNDPEKDVV